MLMLLLKLAAIERDIRLHVKEARGRIAHGQPTSEAYGARLGRGILPGPRNRFDQDRALFIFLSIPRISTAMLPAFAAVKEPLGGANGDDHFAFGARHLHPPNMHL